MKSFEEESEIIANSIIHFMGVRLVSGFKYF